MGAHPVGEGLDEGGALARPARAMAQSVTALTASTSLPSTWTPGKPKPLARWNSGIRDCSAMGSEMAHWLFWQKNTTGAL